MGQAKRRIGHQGVPGAYSDLAATSFFAGMDYEKKAFPYFEDVVVAVMDGTIDYGCSSTPSIKSKPRIYWNGLPKNLPK